MTNPANDTNAVSLACTKDPNDVLHVELDPMNLHAKISIQSLQGPLCPYVLLDDDQIEELHTALGEWLWPGGV